MNKTKKDCLCNNLGLGLDLIVTGIDQFAHSRAGVNISYLAWKYFTIR